MWRRYRIVLFIALGAVAVRLIAINQPFIDEWSWRQSDVAAIARNYFANGFRFAYPQIDWGGDATGYVGTEFPILPFAAATIYKLAGVREWVGRGESVLFFAIGLPFFFLLVRDVFDKRVSVWAAFFYSFAPLSIAASRAFMPDIPSLSLAIIGLYFFLHWLEAQRRSFFFISALVISAALLIKIPTALIGAPLFCFAWQRFGRATFTQPWLWLFAVIALVPSVLWYWHAHQIATRFYPHHFFGAGGFTIENPSWYARIARQTAVSSLTIPLTVLALGGMFVLPQSKYRFAFHWWLAAMLIFIVAAGWGNRHQWYQLPLVPIAAVFAGCACEWIARRPGVRRMLADASIVAIFLGAAFFGTRPFLRPAATSLRDVGLLLKRTAPPGALLIAADDGDPTIFYYAERKGWHFLEN
ncbi:MAG: ArnT family glycosyltransferase, partial [Chthoniobacterales bacterium]